jgi:hypothetical protein
MHVQTQTQAYPGCSKAKSWFSHQHLPIETPWGGTTRKRVISYHPFCCGCNWSSPGFPTHWDAMEPSMHIQGECHSGKHECGFSKQHALALERLSADAS